MDTRKALVEIADLMYLIVDEKYQNQQHFHDTAKNILIELLYGFSAKSEPDLEMVIEFCNYALADLKEKGFQAADSFNFFINRIIENFRSSDKTTKSISDFKGIINVLTY